MMMSNALIELLILITPLASVVVLLYLWYRVFKDRSGGDLPTCAKCGYAVRGLMGLTCPGCGADLREVGIVTPKQRGAVSPVMFVLLWTLLLPGPSCAVSILLSRVGPKTNVTSEVVNLTPIASGQYISVRIGASKNLTSVGTYDTALHIEGNASQEQWESIDPVAMTYGDL